MFYTTITFLREKRDIVPAYLYQGCDFYQYSCFNKCHFAQQKWFQVYGDPSKALRSQGVKNLQMTVRPYFLCLRPPSSERSAVQRESSESVAQKAAAQSTCRKENQILHKSCLCCASVPSKGESRDQTILPAECHRHLGISCGSASEELVKKENSETVHTATQQHPLLVTALQLYLYLPQHKS